MERVEGGGPWSFDNYLFVLLSRAQMGVAPATIPLFHVAFWIQAHNLPLGFMTTTVGTYLGNYIGSFLDYDQSSNTSIWRKYMRIRVLIDVTVKRERKVKVEGGEWNTVLFKYERLGFFAFFVGFWVTVTSFVIKGSHWEWMMVPGCGVLSFRQNPGGRLVVAEATEG